MVRVVEQPSTKRCTCYNCKAVLEYSYSDVRLALERDYGGGGETVYRIQCPNCHHYPSVDKW